ncbi:Cobalamin-dependent protein [Sulfidibacter corallicola]|uniref:Cobalamin-dependent protein n=1 Tax=Sulfidibacter corallicola TaxID=2818388 RepID=A0A8A4TKV2_SULCO|nr:radical SAM protein [Sulfidibacter corallicola]QTD50107.1 cobalamin-dependent protein [Sulfidibacter corallicola]
MPRKDRKLLLIAMSGVRVKDRELLELGMTLPGFVERSQVIASLPSLSLLTVAAHTPANWAITYREVDELNLPRLSSIADEGFDLIGISAFTARILDAYALSDQLRALDQVVVLGGLHVSVLPEEAARHADAIVVGEAEAVWNRLIDDFESQTLKKRYRASEARPKYHLGRSRIPRYDLLDVKKYNRLTLQTTRGCPVDCSFCAASRLISNYKVKPIDLVRRELEAIIDIWPKPFIELADDNTFFNKKWGRHLAQLFSEYRIKWFTETDISIADDEPLLEHLARSGCAQLLIGLESATPESLKEIDARSWKHRQYESYLKSIEKIQSYGISVNGCFILGWDSDDTSIFESTAQFVSDSALAEVQITLLTPFPGTDLYRSLHDSGRLISERFWDKCTLFDTTFHPKRMSADELTAGFRWLMTQIYTRQEHQKRKQKFRSCMRAARITRQSEARQSARLA